MNDHLCTLICIVGGAVAVEAKAQGVEKRLAPTVACESCEIALTHVARIGDADGPGALSSRPYSMARDSRGRFYLVTPETSRETPFVFEGNGRFVTRLGRAGRGPGEYENPSVVVLLPGDSVMVLDRRLARLTVLAPSYDVVRTAPIPAQAYAAVALANGDLVVNANVRTAELAGLPLHRFDAAGNHLKSFGAENPVVRPRYPYDHLRYLAPARAGGVWSVHHLHRYVIESLSGDGVFELRIERVADWFRPYETYWLPSPTTPPATRIMGLWEDDAGLLWVIGHVAGRDWSKGLAPGRLLEGQMSYPVVNDQIVYDGFLDVIDPRAGSVVATKRLPGTLDLVVAPGVVAGLRQAPEGWLYLDVWLTRLVSH